MMITHHVQIKERRFAPSKSLREENYVDVWCMDLLVDGKEVPGRARVPSKSLDRCQVRLSLGSYEEHDSKEPLRISETVPLYAPRSEVLAVWERLVAKWRAEEP